MKKFNTNATVIACAVSVLLVFALPITSFAATAVNLGTAGNFEVLTKTGISTTGTTSIVGDIGVSPVAASYITGFGLVLPSASPFSTTPIVTGKVYASDYANPTPSILTTAVLDMQTAFTNAMGVAPTTTELGAGNIGGLTITPGVYKWSTGVTIPTDVTLSGGPNDVWIFQIAQGLNLSSGAHIILAGGAQASNVFWIVAGQTTIGTTALFNGNILDQTAIVLNTGATLNGRALAQTAVTLESNSLIMPTTPVIVAVTPTPTPTPVTIQTTTTTTQPTTTTTQTSTAQTTTNPTLTTQQQQMYNQFLSAGTSPSVALNAVMQIQPTTQTTTTYTTTSNTNTNTSISTPQIKYITENLYQGSSGSDVTTLQQFLISQNKGSSAQALANVGATGYFGVLTRAALAEFQANVGISPALGNFGTITQGYIAAQY